MSTTETDAPKVGTEVWCPNGHGNRFLDHDDPWPIRCPQCGTPFALEPPAKTTRGRKVRVPELGQIVYVRMSEDQTRPAVVMGRNAENGVCLIHIFKHERDLCPPGLRQEAAAVPYGNTIGTWHWPPRQDEQHFMFEE